MKYRRTASLAALILMAALSSPALAYVDLAPTVAKIITDSKSISLVKVVEFDPAKHIVTLAEIKTLKGTPATAPLQQTLVSSETPAVPQALLQWAEPGTRKPSSFPRRGTAVVCVGESWYEVQLVGSKWKLGADRPELPLSYYGTVTRLADGVEKMLAGDDAILTMIPHGVEHGASFDIALNRSALPGLVRVQRLRANLKMPGVVFSVSNNPLYMLGMGPVDESELPNLIQQLQSPDANARAEAADDIRQLTDIIGTSKTSSAAPALEKKLDDENARARFLAAGALLRITHNHDAATAVLLKGFQSASGTDRRDAARASAVTGKSGAPLVAGLSKLLQDSDTSVVMAALQAIATLGPAALPARDAVIPLLDQDSYQITAADALGRMGPRAQPVPPSMVKMLGSDQSAVRWAALRGMSQIGGKEAIPAAECIAQNVSKVGEIEGYNMVICLGLLGPVARGPAAKIKTLPFGNPALPLATNWAMNAESSLPWQSGMDGTFGDVGNFIYSAYVTELGERLKPCALTLAPKLINGTAGDVPDWGYRILNAAPDESVAIIAPHLADASRETRERAAVALGYMGPAAGSARKQLETALAATSDEQEQRLLAWSLREIADQ